MLKTFTQGGGSRPNPHETPDSHVAAIKATQMRSSEVFSAANESGLYQ